MATRYYDAFRARDLDAACGLVADRLLPSRIVVGVNTRDGKLRGRLPAGSPSAGCAAVRQRREGWTEPLPRSAWKVTSVLLDDEQVRARVDTSGEGSYWLRRELRGWRIVGFGALTDAAFRRFAGSASGEPFGPA